MKTFLIKAPTGGAVSCVNDKFYAGGEFMPDSGEFCGAKRMAKKFANVSGENWAELTVACSTLFLVYVRTAGAKFKRPLVRNSFKSKSEAVAFCEEVVKLRSASYVSRKLEPHPTKIVIC